MKLEQIFEQWKEGLQVEAKLSYREESSLIIYSNGELADKELNEIWKILENGDKS